MNCPICTTFALQPATLAENLAAQSCPHCSGVLLSSAQYWAWRDQHGPICLSARPRARAIEAEPARAKQSRSAAT